MKPSINWNKTVENLGPKLYRYFCGCFDHNIADDLTQETLIRLVNKCSDDQYNSTKGSLDMYAFGIARFVRLEALKQNKKAHQELDSDPPSMDDSAFDDLANNQQIQSLRTSIRALPEPQQEIILLMIDKEFTAQKISEFMEMPIGTIKSHIHRAKKSLSEQLNNGEIL